MYNMGRLRSLSEKNNDGRGEVLRVEESCVVCVCVLDTGGAADRRGTLPEKPVSA